MPKIKISFLTIFILGILVLFYYCIPQFFKQNVSTTQKPSKTENPSLFESISVTEFNPADLPCINIEIEGKKFLAILDLGFCGYISLFSSSLSKIEEKSFVKTISKWGFRGKENISNVYKIPKMSIQNVGFYNPTLEEENESQRKDSILISSNDKPRKEVGKLGWFLFEKSSLFLDLGHSKIAICDSPETFTNQGYSLNHFTKIPFWDSRNLIEFKITTPNGPICCFLDTGCTSNLLNTDNLNNESMEDLYLNEKNYVNFSTFKIGGKDFGPITFRPIPIKLPIKVDAILGIEFLFEHQVLIDFKNHQIYIAPAE